MPRGERSGHARRTRNVACNGPRNNRQPCQRHRCPQQAPRGAQAHMLLPPQVNDPSMDAGDDHAPAMGPTDTRATRGAYESTPWQHSHEHTACRRGPLALVHGV